MSVSTTYFRGVKNEGLQIPTPISLPFPSVPLVSHPTIGAFPPQILILSHQAIGAFLTHSGWNSTLEGICSGIPQLTWPLFLEQFINEKLVMQILGIGIGVGSKSALHLGKENDIEVSVKRDDVAAAIEKIMAGDEEGEERRRAREVGEMAKKAIEKGESSYQNLTLFVQDIAAIQTKSCLV